MLRERFDHGFTERQWAGRQSRSYQRYCEERASTTFKPDHFDTPILSIKSTIKLERHDARLAHMLGEISSEEDAAGRGMLTVLDRSQRRCSARRRIFRVWRGLLGVTYEIVRRSGSPNSIA